MLEWLEGTEFSTLLRTELWGWPLALTLHVLGTAIVVGFILIICLRLLGLFELIPYSALNRLFPVVWAAFGLQVFTGLLLWMTKPTRYVVDNAFLLKVALVIAGMVLTYRFAQTLMREAPQWQSSGAVSARTSRLVAALLVIWCSVVIVGRLTGYLGAI